MRIDCSCGKSHNGKTAVRIMKKCGGRAVMPAPRVAAPGGQPMMVGGFGCKGPMLPPRSLREPATFTAGAGGILRDIPAERLATQRFERVGGTL